MMNNTLKILYNLYLNQISPSSICVEIPSVLHKTSLCLPVTSFSTRWNTKDDITTFYTCLNFYSKTHQDVKNCLNIINKYHIPYKIYLEKRYE